MIQNAQRRTFLVKAVRGASFAAVGAFTWFAFTEKAKAAPLSLRPPGSLAEEEFIATCIKCGLCVEACPFDVLHVAQVLDAAPIGTPYFKPRENACRMCRDIPCVPPCPTGALSLDKLKNGTPHASINNAQMGVAIIDTDQCIAFWGIQCDACYRACPLMGTAIVIDDKPNERTGKHAFLVPRVIATHCTGCGMCEHACVTQKASIKVLPRAVAKGKAGKNYVKGWDENDEKRIDGNNIDTHIKTPKSEKSAVDYLNSGDL